MDTIDITPTPVELAAIAQRIITAAYGLECHDLTKYQVIWAWTAAEHAAERIGTPIQDLPARLGCELLRMYLARARAIPDRPITDETTYDQLNQRIVANRVVEHERQDCERVPDCLRGVVCRKLADPGLDLTGAMPLSATSTYAHPCVVFPLRCGPVAGTSLSGLTVAEVR